MWQELGRFARVGFGALRNRPGNSLPIAADALQSWAVSALLFDDTSLASGRCFCHPAAVFRVGVVGSRFGSWVRGLVCVSETLVGSGSNRSNRVF